MAKRNIPGLQFRKGVWHVDKVIDGKRICQSLGTGDQQEAETILAQFIFESRKAKIFGVRPKRIFREAAIKYLEESENNSSIESDACHLKALDSFIGDLPLNLIHDGTLAPFIKASKYVTTVRHENGVAIETKRLRKHKSINLALSVVRRILNLCARKWRDDDNGLTWLESAPLITFLETSDERKAYPVSWKEQKALIAELPGHLASMLLFKVNTGCREQEVCKLQWDWEVEVPELNTSVFIVPAKFGGRNGKGGVKNQEDRVVVLNRVASSVIEAQRGKHPIYVFPVDGKPMHRMNNSAWDSATARAAEKLALEEGKPVNEEFFHLRVHDIKHTLGRRLRAAGVSNETRKVLLGHTNGDITTDYSAGEIGELICAVEKVCDSGVNLPTLTLLRSAKMNGHAKVTHKRKMG
ncbi:tyrosine-type recombinase/integrase [Methylotenera sp. L2L1]|uniref:tyrosine-type recombinase/integrase n=1 Tax=Methylotenera sp. L2L1 TaxID=1502770 RepID=UPI000689831A|nr:tyrosine-type recombinase/integrase [Methylotenera sp. L2L1]